MKFRSEGPRILSQAECEAIAAKLSSLLEDGSTILPIITSWWQGELRWGRNRVTLSSDRQENEVWVVRDFQANRSSPVAANQIDPVSLAAIVEEAKRLGFHPSRRTTIGFEHIPDSPGLSFDPPTPGMPMPATKIWSDGTAHLTPQARVAAASALIKPAAAQGMLAAGYIEARVGVRFQYINHAPYYLPFTQARCSMTVRDTAGTGSGWSGASSYDWEHIDAPALAKRAVEKCVASRNPVALEPGRYTVILEPQAVADLMESLVKVMVQGPPIFGGSATGPFADPKTHEPKWGLKIVDPRITISYDPADPQLGVLPMPGLPPVTWIDQGKLTALGRDRMYGVSLLHKNPPVPSPEVSYKMSGGSTSIEEMIATTARGVLVTRFYGVEPLSTDEAASMGSPWNASLLCTGLTRDGLWLIENGKITKAIKNFRFTDSPLFVLNQLEQVGVSVPVFRPVATMARDEDGDPHAPDLTPAIVPALKARDFSFVAMADAV